MATKKAIKRVEEAKVVKEVETVEIPKKLFMSLFAYLGKQKAEDVCYTMVEMDNIFKENFKTE